MNRNRKQVLLLLPLLLMLMGLKACEDWRENAAIYMRDYAEALASVQNAEIDAHRLNYVSDVDHRSFQSAVLKLSAYGKAANSALRFGGRGVALGQIDAALKELDALQSKGLLGVKNEQSRAAISALVLAVRGILTGAKVQLQ